MHIIIMLFFKNLTDGGTTREQSRTYTLKCNVMWCDVVISIVVMHNE